MYAIEDSVRFKLAFWAFFAKLPVSVKKLIYKKWPISPRASSRLNHVVEAKGFEGVSLCKSMLNSKTKVI